MGCFCLLIARGGRIEASSLTSWSLCFLFCKGVMCDSKALSLLPFPTGSPLCPPQAGLAPGFKLLMAYYAPAHFVAITLLTGLRDSYAPQYKVRSTLPLSSSLSGRSQLWGPSPTTFPLVTIVIVIVKMGKMVRVHSSAERVGEWVGRYVA